MDYQFEVKQIVDYLRYRIYREFIHSLMEDRDIRTNGSPYLVGPGEWICKILGTIMA